MVLVTSYASSLRAWLQQRDALATARAEIAASSSSTDALEREKRRWHDPAYVEKQARARFGWVLPGEVGYRVIGADDKPLGDTPTLTNAPAGSGDDEQWYERLWQSVESAGEEPESDKAPAPAPRQVIKPNRDDVSKGGGQ